MTFHVKLNLSLLLTALVAWSSANAESPDERPNIVVILADDLGYGDVQPLNSESRIETPNFARLANEGMTFKDAHSPSAVCTPTRYGLMCGRYSWRTSMKKGVLGGYSEPLIQPDRQTIAGVLKTAGYRTGCIGKWHLGLGWQLKDQTDRDAEYKGISGNKAGLVDYSKPLTHGPTFVGFDSSLIIPASLDMSPYVYVRDDRVTAIPDKVIKGERFPVFYRKGEIAADFEMDSALDRLTEEACEFIRDSSESDNPFFLYFPLTAPHKPVLPHERFRGTTELGEYGDFIAQVDWTVGQVMQALDEAGAADNTLLIVTSDNGSFMYSYPDKEVDHLGNSQVQGYHPDTHRSNANWRGTKADIWEAGHRVPFFVRWPSTIGAASTSDATICHTDLLATVAEVAQVDFDQTSAEDSFSFLSALKGQQHERKPVIHQSGSGFLAIRDGDWKLILGSGSGGREKPRGNHLEEPFHLYNLRDDPAEQNNLIKTNSEQAKMLHEAFLEISRGDHPPAEPKSQKNKK